MTTRHLGSAKPQHKQGRFQYCRGRGEKTQTTQLAKNNAATHFG